MFDFINLKYIIHYIMNIKYLYYSIVNIQFHNFMVNLIIINININNYYLNQNNN